MVKTRFLVWFSLIPLAIVLEHSAISSSCAQEKEIPELRSRILQLEKRVVELESLLAEAEEAKKTISSDRTGWQNKKNWRSLSLGMRDGEVKKILGEPSKVIQGTQTLWYYPNLYCGYVTFDDKGQLTGWNEP
jgi:outer membrane protein assembly factor BamE (lipoprotein component of BamABCDE complex)